MLKVYMLNGELSLGLKYAVGVLRLARIAKINLLKI